VRCASMQSSSEMSLRRTLAIRQLACAGVVPATERPATPITPVTERPIVPVQIMTAVLAAVVIRAKAFRHDVTYFPDTLLMHAMTWTPRDVGLIHPRPLRSAPQSMKSGEAFL